MNLEQVCTLNIEQSRLLQLVVLYLPPFKRMLLFVRSSIRVYLLGLALSPAQCPVSCSLNAPSSARTPPLRSYWPPDRPIRRLGGSSKEPPGDQAGDTEEQWPLSASWLLQYTCIFVLRPVRGLSPGAVCLTLTPRWHYCTSSTVSKSKAKSCYFQTK